MVVVAAVMSVYPSGAACATKTRPVLDHERLPIKPLELAADEPGEDAVHATGRGRRNDGDGAVRIILRPRGQSGEQDKTDEDPYRGPCAFSEREWRHGFSPVSAIALKS